jgi:hypothetical protein
MAPSRLRLGPALAPTLFGVLAAGVLIAALVITGRSQHLAPDRQAARPAPPPAGTLEVGGVYLTPTGAPFRRRCQQAADRVGFAVPCPVLLPATPG